MNGYVGKKQSIIAQEQSKLICIMWLFSTEQCSFVPEKLDSEKSRVLDNVF